MVLWLVQPLVENCRQGRIAREWRGVKADGHAREVLDYVRSAEL